MKAQRERGSRHRIGTPAVRAGAGARIYGRGGVKAKPHRTSSRGNTFARTSPRIPGQDTCPWNPGEIRPDRPAVHAHLAWMLISQWQCAQRRAREPEVRQ